MANGGGVTQSPATLFQARLDTADGVSNTLTLRQYQGNKVMVSGHPVVIPPAGLTRLVTDHLITAAGADSGAVGVASTLYYVYVSNFLASFSPSSIRLSAQAPTLVNGVKYLGATLNALNWRFVGWVRLNATPQFESSLTSRTIVNYYNRTRLSLFTCPAYVDDNLQTSYNLVSVVWVALNGGTGSRVLYIANGEDAQSFGVTAEFGPGVGQQAALGIGIDTTATSKIAKTTPTVSNIFSDVTGTYDEIAAEGVHTADILGSNTGGTTVVIVDDVRRGGTKDPFVTYLSGTIWG